MSGAVFHQGAAQVAIGKLPGTGQIHDTIANIRFWLEQSGQGAPVAQHSRCCRAYLHKTNLSDPSDSSRIIGALDLRHRVGNLARKACLLCLAPGDVKMCPTP